MSSAFLFINPPPPTTSSAAAAAAKPSHSLPPDRLASLIDKSKTVRELLRIHASLIRHGLENHLVLNFKLQRSYSSLGRLDYSVSLFNRTSNPSVFFYTAVIHGHAVNNLHNQALEFYVQMLTHYVEPNAFTFSSILKNIPPETGRTLHAHILKFGLDSDTYVRTALVDAYSRGGDVISARHLFDTMPERSLVSLTTMITGYAKHGHLDEARSLFDRIEDKDVVCWNVMIDGYAQNGKPNEALFLFRQMLSARMKPNELTVLSVLSSCGQVGALESGKWVHSYIKSRISINPHVGTALIDMYSKCGSLDNARSVFDLIKDKDVVVWNSMIVGYAMHGFSQQALLLFEKMLSSSLLPTDITFIGVLNACAHAGLVSKGWDFFNSMKNEYNIKPKIEHYGCMVNLLGRAGHLKEAYKLIKDIEMEEVEPDPVLYGTLLGACKLHGNVDLAEQIVKWLVHLNLANSGTYILMSNIYAAVGDFEGAARVRKAMREFGVQKEPGCSSIELNGKIHEFLAGGTNHEKIKEIYRMVEEIGRWLQARGYRPRTDTVLHDIEERGKQRSLEVHSEKLAIAYGLISSEPGSTIKVVKNLRVCSDCHEVTKIISEITGRKIVVRDRNRFHHFEGGLCSCGDYW